MANVKRNAKERRILAEKESIASIARWILVAFCLQFVFYIGIINVVPMLDPDTQEVNSLYTEKWINYKGSEGDVHTEGNGIKFIYTYNMVLLVASTGLILYYAMIFLEEYEGIVSFKAKEFFIEHKGVLFLIIFMVWVFLSSCLAYDKFRSFIGCYNLRDGFFSFMFYGNILVCTLLMGISGFEGKVKVWFEKIEIDPRKIIVDTFLVVMTLIAVITIGDYVKVNSVDGELTEIVYEDGARSGDGVGISIEPKIVLNAKDSRGGSVQIVKPRVSKASVTSSVFNNSNHYAYVLSIAVIVAAVMFIKDKNIISKVLYMLSFVILTYMLIINDTFGAYLGIMVALALIFVHAILTIVVEALSTTKNINVGSFVLAVFVLIVFAVASITIKNPNKENIVGKNFAYIGNSINAILGIEKEELDNNYDKDVLVSGEVLSGELASVEQSEAEKKNENQIEAGNAGSGRWKLWVGALEIIKKKPIFGAGLENMIYEYSKIGIGEGRSHNLLLQLAGTTGIPGMFLYVLGMAFIFFKALKYYRIWDTYTYMGMFVMISYLLSSLTGNSGFYTSGYFYIFVGFVVLGTIACKNQVDGVEAQSKVNSKSIVQSKKPRIDKF